ncbi:MAG: Gfo/Idh/MocA family oxidoreductase [Anaerolineales bacterium]|nr:Gfo/Idh/MocA family oxidoreductase [Anaerolineales bacterium]
MSRLITAILIGAGGRGSLAYGPYALEHPDEIKFVAVAEPRPTWCDRFAEAHAIPANRQFDTWEDLLALGKIADTALVCTLDRMHTGPTLSALALGYDVLLEKPMSTNLTESVQLVQAAEDHGRLLQICHVLRYTAFFSSLHEIIASGRLGEIITVEHRENVHFKHMSHSFVRGNWRNADLESPMILAKCCHDLDILHWNLGTCIQMQSFGSLRHFRPENAPPGAPLRCTDGCPAASTCPWDSRRVYLGADRDSMFVTMAAGKDPSTEVIQQALETGPYGRCVYHCDNNVVDHQTLNMMFENDTSVIMSMHGHAHQESRTTRYDGTRATLRGKFAYGLDDTIEIHDHLSGQVEVLYPSAGDSGHGGGDEGLMAGFVSAIHNPSRALTTARESLESHLMAFAAEESRLNGQVTSMEAYRRQAEKAAREKRGGPA